MADIVIINPKFEISFWGLEESLHFFGKRANLPVGALPLIAALTPPEHCVTLVDENVEAIDFDRCQRADIVGVTGMSVQRHRMVEIVTELKKRGCYVVIGGPWVSVKEDYFDNLADVVFVGEAEDTWPQFLRDWQEGKATRRYEQAAMTDMTRVPAPRFDLLKMNRYLFGSVQFSRGCPFQCEFCDIIVVHGRKPRIKTPAQILAELDVLRAAKVPLVFVVDDNLIGNKKEIKKVLKQVIAWQQAKGYPLTFVTEALLDLADDDELMQLMVEANFNGLFVGIESTNADLRYQCAAAPDEPGGFEPGLCAAYARSLRAEALLRPRRRIVADRAGAGRAGVAALCGNAAVAAPAQTGAELGRGLRLVGQHHVAIARPHPAADLSPPVPCRYAQAAGWRAAQSLRVEMRSPFPFSPARAPA